MGPLEPGLQSPDGQPGDVALDRLASEEGLLRVRLKDGWLGVPEVHFAGGRRMDARSFHMGYLHKLRTGVGKFA